MRHPFGLLQMLLLFTSSRVASAASYNVASFGARPYALRDSAKPFLAAWAAACSSRTPATMHVPEGRFLVSKAIFRGPCKSSRTTVHVDGTVVAPAGYTGAATWLKFQYVHGLSIVGGIFDGRGQALWSCKKSGRRSCPTGATSLYVGQCKDVVVKNVRLMNSEVFQMAIFASTGVAVRRATILAPEDSPNTDGIHIQLSSSVAVVQSTMATGDDCISMGPGSADIYIANIKCGPGHGISIGSMGGTQAEPGVRNVTVTSVVFSGTQNGLRIKTKAAGYSGFVKDVKFEHVIMKNVQNPIVIDQKYCPSRINCPLKSSGVKISQVLFNDVRGTSANPVAVKLECSKSNRCTGIKLRDINLRTTSKKPAQSYCENVLGTTSGTIDPRGCL